MKRTVIILLIVFSMCSGSCAKIAEEYFNSGDTHFGKWEYDKAIKDFTEAIRLNPHYAKAYASRGGAYFNKDEYDKAIADYTVAINSNPGYILFNEIYFDRGNAYFNKKDYDKAIKDFEEVLSTYPDHAKAKESLEKAKQARGY